MLFIYFFSFDIFDRVNETNRTKFIDVCVCLKLVFLPCDAYHSRSHSVVNMILSFCLFGLQPTTRHVYYICIYRFSWYQRFAAYCCTCHSNPAGVLCWGCKNVEMCRPTYLAQSNVCQLTKESWDGTSVVRESEYIQVPYIFQYNYNDHRFGLAFKIKSDYMAFLQIDYRIKTVCASYICVCMCVCLHLFICNAQKRFSFVNFENSGRRLTKKSNNTLCLKRSKNGSSCIILDY